MLDDVRCPASDAWSRLASRREATRLCSVGTNSSFRVRPAVSHQLQEACRPEPLRLLPAHPVDILQQQPHLLLLFDGSQESAVVPGYPVELTQVPGQVPQRGGEGPAGSLVLPAKGARQVQQVYKKLTVVAPGMLKGVSQVYQGMAGCWRRHACQLGTRLGFPSLRQALTRGQRLTGRCRKAASC